MAPQIITDCGNLERCDIVCSGSWCTGSSRKTLLAKLPQVLESALLVKPLEAVVISVAFEPLPSTFSLLSTFNEYVLTQHSVNNQSFQKWLSVPCTPCGGWKFCRSAVFSIIVFRALIKDRVSRIAIIFKYWTFPKHSKTVRYWTFDFDYL